MLRNPIIRLRALLAAEPAAVLYSVNAGLAPLTAILLHWDHAQVAATATITAALAAIMTAFKARPVAIPALLGAAATIATACAVFGLRLSPDQIAAGTSALNLLLAFAFRANLVPLVSLRPPPGR